MLFLPYSRMNLIQYSTVFFLFGGLWATAWGADGDPAVRHVGLITPSILAVTIDEGRIERGRIVDYVPERNDSVPDYALHENIYGFLAAMQGTKPPSIPTIEPGYYSQR